jgi:ABC-type Fe3+/spermidine/putrescine transport system ATPase subunit
MHAGLDLTLTRVGHRYPTFALKGISIRPAAGQRLAILGPSGSGKSTLLKLIGGHLRLDEGQIDLGGIDISRRHPSERPTITVFQDHALFPHMSVFGNVEFPLQVSGNLSTAERHRLVMDYLRRFDIADRMNAPPDELSGGERQRVALARALILNPAVLLLDEPTASLDAEQKRTLEHLLLETSIGANAPTILIVTHDHEFAFAMCDEMAILHHGVLIAQGPTREMILHPPNEGVARLLGRHTILRGTVDGLIFVPDGTDAHSVTLPPSAAAVQGRAVLAIRADAMSLAASDGTETRSIRAKVRQVQFRGAFNRVIAEVGPQDLFCDVPGVVPPPAVTIGDTTDFRFATSEALLIDAGRSDESLKETNHGASLRSAT